MITHRRHSAFSRSAQGWRSSVCPAVFSVERFHGGKVAYLRVSSGAVQSRRSRKEGVGGAVRGQWDGMPLLLAGFGLKRPPSEKNAFSRAVWDSSRAPRDAFCAAWGDFSGFGMIFFAGRDEFFAIWDSPHRVRAELSAARDSSHAARGNASAARDSSQTPRDSPKKPAG